MLSAFALVWWTIFPWAACLSGGFLLGRIVPDLIGPCDSVQRGVAFMVTGALAGVGTSIVFAIPEAWIFPLFTMGSWLAARGAFGLNGSDGWNPGNGPLHRLSQGIWCLGVSCALVYGATHYSGLQRLAGVAQVVAYTLASGAVLFFALALAACLLPNRGNSVALRTVQNTREAHAMRPSIAEDYPTVPSTLSSMSLTTSRDDSALAHPRIEGQGCSCPCHIAPSARSWYPAWSALASGSDSGRRAAGSPASVSLPSDGATRGVTRGVTRAGDRDLSAGAGSPLPLPPLSPRPRRFDDQPNARSYR